MDALHAVPILLFQRLDWAWTFFLLLTRYMALLMQLPGLSGGKQGLMVRVPGALVLSGVSVVSGPAASLPGDWFLGSAALLSEYLLGTMLGMIPSMMLAGLEAAAQMAGVTMGLAAAQLIDPRTGNQSSPLAILTQCLVTCLFLLVGGHHVVLYAAAGLGGTLIPGTYLVGEGSLRLFMERSGNIFTAGVMLSAPVVVALMLTQFVLGVVSKAVPTVNVFIVSFPLTIGIGLTLTCLSLPEMLHYCRSEILTSERQVMIVVDDMQPAKARTAASPLGGAFPPGGKSAAPANP